jgi:hypothetical protein
MIVSAHRSNRNALMTVSTLLTYPLSSESCQCTVHTTHRATAAANGNTLKPEGFAVRWG